MDFNELFKKLRPRLERLSKRNYYFSGAFDSSDLFQEALVNLWQRLQSQEFEGKNDSYILKSCYFHIQNFMRTNKDNTDILSIDGLIDAETGYTYKDSLPNNTLDPKDFLSDRLTVNEMLNNSLTKREKEVFRLMLEGSNIREVARKMGISHVRVIKIKNNIKRKYRNKIA